MASAFGKALRILRVNNDEVLGDMAAKLGVSIAFLSKVENGIAKPSDKIINGVIEHYELSEAEKEQLILAAKSDVSIDVSDFELKKKKLTMYFAQAVSNLTDKQVEQIDEILNLVLK